MSYNDLKRNVFAAPSYNKVIPQINGINTKLGKGNTNFSVQMIAMWIAKYKHQSKEVAKQLQSNNLEETLFNVHSFLYNGFQYKPDGKKQLIKALSYAWENRFDGMDCKSYTTVGGQILASLGLKFYIRQIKQADFYPNYFSHVYLIVPKNQNTGDLKSGYYTVDGTLKTMDEPKFIEAKDKFMSEFEHYGLAGFKLDSSTLQNFLNTPISCIGGTSFDKTKANEVHQQIQNYFEMVLNALNTAVSKLDYGGMSYELGKFQTVLGTSINAYSTKKSEGWNKCTTESISKMQKLLEFYQKTVEITLVAWLNKYFDVTATGKVFDSHNKNTAYFETTDPAFYFTYTSPQVGYSAPTYNFKVKDNVSTIPAYEFTPYLQNAATNPSGLNVNDFLNGLTTVLAVVQSSGNGSNSGSNSGSGGGEIIDYGDDTDEPKKAGFGLLGGIVLTAIAIGVATQLKPNQNTKTSKSTKTTK